MFVTFNLERLHLVGSDVISLLLTLIGKCASVTDQVILAVVFERMKWSTQSTIYRTVSRQTNLHEPFSISQPFLFVVSYIFPFCF